MWEKDWRLRFFVLICLLCSNLFSRYKIILILNPLYKMSQCWVIILDLEAKLYNVYCHMDLTMVLFGLYSFVIFIFLIVMEAILLNKLGFTGKSFPGSNQYGEMNVKL